jgi:hypothetical protein
VNDELRVWKLLLPNLTLQGNHINVLIHRPVSVRMVGHTGDHTLSSADIMSSLGNDESVNKFSDEREPDFTGNKSDSDNETADDSNGDEIHDAGSMIQKQITSLNWVWQTVGDLTLQTKFHSQDFLDLQKAPLLRLIPSFCFSTPN